ncbi:putative zinc finger (CCCH type) protein [Neospora caninum Liverpool]|nr:putative zinc finger (CCCH type) protein [Neospora caninum Liverpool]CBZ55767.1 putative zinc finger (CCCH type) protein [Neospora caninum Liverpool]|eukprot:XP_003885793.1 putative zinc finger (CCCH type) protein [Neospora caninum Liverpool]
MKPGSVERDGGTGTPPVYEQPPAGVNSPLMNATERFVCEREDVQTRLTTEDEAVKVAAKVDVGSGSACADPVSGYSWPSTTVLNVANPEELCMDTLLHAPGTQSTLDAPHNSDADVLLASTSSTTETGLLRRSPSSCDAMSSFERERLLEQRRLQAQVLHLQRKVILQEQLLLQQQGQLTGYAADRGGGDDRDRSDAAALACNISTSKFGKDDGKARRGRNEIKGFQGRSSFLPEKLRGGRGAVPSTGSGRTSGALEPAPGTGAGSEPRSRQENAKSRSGSAADAELQEYVATKKLSEGRKVGEESLKRELVAGRVGVAPGGRDSRSQSFSGSAAQGCVGFYGGRSLKDALSPEDAQRAHEGKRDKEEESEGSGYAVSGAPRTLGQGGRVGNRCRAQSDFTDGSFKKKAGRIEDQFFRIKLCPKYMRGLCRKGARCSYAHAEEELRDVPNLWKTKLCTAFRLGKPCPLEASCPYAHGEEELRSTADYYKTKLCKFWMREGRCDAGKACRHAHGDQELRKRNYRHTELEKFALRHHLDMRQLLDEFRTGRVPVAIQDLVSTSTVVGSGAGRSHGGASPISSQGQSSACENHGRPRFFSFTAACVERKPRSNSGESSRLGISASRRGLNDDASSSSGRDEGPATGSGPASEGAANSGGKAGGPGQLPGGKPYRGQGTASFPIGGAQPAGCGGEVLEGERRGGHRGGSLSHFHLSHGHQYRGGGRGGRHRHGHHQRHRFDTHQSLHRLHQSGVVPATADALKGTPLGVPVVAATAGGPPYGIAPGVTPYGSLCQQQAYPYALNYTTNLAACGGLHAAAAAVAAAAVAQQHQHLEVAAKVAGTPLYPGVDPYLGAPYNSNFPGGGIPYSASVPAGAYATAGPSSSGTAGCASAPFTPASRPYSPPGGPYSARTASTTGATPSPQTSYSGHGNLPFSPPCPGSSPRGSPDRETATPSAVLHAAATGTMYPGGTPTAEIGAGAARAAGDPGSFASATQYSHGQLAGATTNAVYSAIPGSAVNPSGETAGMCHGECLSAAAQAGTEGSGWMTPGCGRVSDRLRQTGAMDRASLGSLLSTGLTVPASGASMVDRASVPDHPIAMCAIPGVATGASFCQWATGSASPAGLPGTAGPAISPFYVPTSTYPVYPATHAPAVARMQHLTEIDTGVGRENSVQSE